MPFARFQIQPVEWGENLSFEIERAIKKGSLCADKAHGEAGVVLCFPLASVNKYQSLSLSVQIGQLQLISLETEKGNVPLLTFHVFAALHFC